MAFQTYLVSCPPICQIDTLKSVASQIQSLGGMILLVTRQRVLVAGFDDSHVERVRRCPGVEFVGGVTLDPRGVATQQLYQAFAQSLAIQVPVQADSQPGDSNRF